MEGTNLTNIQYASIGDQAKFIDTIKYYHQLLGSLSASIDTLDKKNIRKSCKSFIKKFNYFSDVYNSLADEEKAWVLDYLSADKGAIPYEKVKTYEDLLAQPESRFFAKTKFYSSLRNEIIRAAGKKIREIDISLSFSKRAPSVTITRKFLISM